MKILVIADEESRSLWDYWDKSKTDGIDLILSCGDLKAEYLSFLTTMTNADVLYVHGNHDESYLQKSPEGCICVDDKIINYNEIRIFGLGGSMRYGNGHFQFTEKEMQSRIRKRRLSLIKNKGFDILLTHAPARNINDMDDLTHKGFSCFNELIQKYNPKFFIHGHVHKTYGHFQRTQTVGETTVVNAFEKYIIEI
ncbi:MAG: metallophosphoesterase family protein [Ruminococcus sp.]|nr:metallophosphoesterase family protein [Ruminococcus sp.]